MAYVRRTWQERVGTLLNRFTKSSETSASVVLVNDPDTITQAGTPFTAAAMNNIEDGIVEALAKVPTGVNNNVLLSDGAGKAKDSGKAIGNASGNVPLSNGTKCVNLYAADSARLVEQPLFTSGNIVTQALAYKTGSRFRFNNEGAGVTGLPATSPPTYGTVEIWGTDGDVVFCHLRDSLTLSTWIARIFTGWPGTWTQLTGASGNAINANSLGGVAAAFYTGFIGNGAALQSGAMTNGGYITASYSGHVAITVAAGGYVNISISGRVVFLDSASGSKSYILAFPIKAAQVFAVSSDSFTSASYTIKAALV